MNNRPVPDGISLLYVLLNEAQASWFSALVSIREVTSRDPHMKYPRFTQPFGFLSNLKPRSASHKSVNEFEGAMKDADISIPVRPKCRIWTSR